jgi:hypothetical protein
LNEADVSNEIGNQEKRIRDIREIRGQRTEACNDLIHPGIWVQSVGQKHAATPCSAACQRVKDGNGYS